MVLTGGEPMLFEESVVLCDELRKLGHHITIETAGTVFRPVACDLMSISPKLSNSTPHQDPYWSIQHEKLRLQPEVLRRLMGHCDYQLKFVVASPEDIPEIEELLHNIGGIEPSSVLLMPEGRDAEKLWQTARSLVPEVMKRNWRLAPRLQIDLFGDTKGT
jgi:7-carboxy-7-deazaguanine synthase